MKNLLLPLVFVALSFSSCEKARKLTQFEKEFTTSVTIPMVTTMVASPLSLTTPEIKTDISNYLSANSIDASLIEKISLKKLSMKIVSPDVETFKFLSSVEIFIYNPDSTLVSKVASLSDVPANQSIELIVENADLKKFILQDAFKLSFKITSKEAIKSDYIVEVKPTFLLDVGVLGL